MLDHKDFMTGLEDLKNMRAKKRKMEEEVKELNGEIAKLVYDLVEYMQETDQTQVKIGSIGTCSLTSMKTYSVENP